MPKPPPPTPERVRELIAATRQPRKVLAAMLGYASENSLRQCEEGKASLSPKRAAWLERYARVRQQIHDRAENTEAVWHKKNPQPGPE